VKKISKAIVLAAVLGLLPVQVAVSQTNEPTQGKPVMIPTRYYEGRFYANPETLDNAKLDLLTDTKFADVDSRMKMLFPGDPNHRA
jgi:hypothetical protein